MSMCKIKPDKNRVEKNIMGTEQKEEFLKLVKPMEREKRKLEILSFILFLFVFLYGCGLLLYFCASNELYLHKQNDWMYAIISLIALLLVDKFIRNLNHSLFYQIRSVNYILLFTNIVLYGNKYTMLFFAALLIYLLKDIKESDVQCIRNTLLGTAIMLGGVELCDIYLRVMTNGSSEQPLLGNGIDIFIATAVFLFSIMGGKSASVVRVLNKLITNNVIILTSGLMCVTFAFLMHNDGKWDILLGVLKESFFQVGIVLVLLIIVAFRPWRYKINRTCNVREWKNYLERFFLIIGVLLLLSFSILQPFIKRVAERRGLTSKYTEEDFFNGTIELKGFEIGEDGTLISIETDPWIIVYRKDELVHPISRIALDVDFLSNNEEVAQCYVFHNEDDWSEGVLVENYQMQQGESVIMSDILGYVDRYVRMDLTAQEGTEIRLNGIQFYSYFDVMIWIAYLGIGCVILSIGLLIKKIVRGLSGKSNDV